MPTRLPFLNGPDITRLFELRAWDDARAELAEAHDHADLICAYDHGSAGKEEKPSRRSVRGRRHTLSRKLRRHAPADITDISPGGHHRIGDRAAGTPPWTACIRRCEYSRANDP